MTNLRFSLLLAALCVAGTVQAVANAPAVATTAPDLDLAIRSEERRVGKECPV